MKIIRRFYLTENINWERIRDLMSLEELNLILLSLENSKLEF